MLRAFKYLFLWSIATISSISCNLKTGSNTVDPVVPALPKALMHDTKVEFVMKIRPLAVRIAKNPVTGQLFYICFNGDVYKIASNRAGSFSSIQMLSSKDHGITKLQGMAFIGSKLFLCGNLTSNNGLNNIGRMVNFDLDTWPLRMTTVFNTVEYGTNQTTFDHGWNAISVSPDKDFIYVNSGSRTDHGEVQDNGGAWPRARNGALTAKIFRIPATAKDLILRDDVEFLKSAGYIYAEGIRNAFALAFDSNNNLFGAVNSGDYDHPEDLFWIREGHHYGFPWIMGGIENPQQFNNYQPDLAKDRFLNESSFAFRMGYFHKDPEFPPKPVNRVFTKGIINLGPDANQYRDTTTGEINDNDTTQYKLTTFTPHSSPVGLVFDTKEVLSSRFKGSGFLLRYASAQLAGNLLEPFANEGGDLLNLKLFYNRNSRSFQVVTTRIVEGFNKPIDCLLIDNKLYVIEFNEFESANMWKITLN